MDCEHSDGDSSSSDDDDDDDIDSVYSISTGPREPSTDLVRDPCGGRVGYCSIYNKHYRSILVPLTRTAMTVIELLNSQNAMQFNCHYSGCARNGRFVSRTGLYLCSKHSELEDCCEFELQDARFFDFVEAVCRPRVSSAVKPARWIGDISQGWFVVLCKSVWKKKREQQSRSWPPNGGQKIPLSVLLRVYCALCEFSSHAR